MRDLHKVIQTIRLTEKATLLSEKNNEYVFRVDPQATKIDIKQAVEKLFGKKVDGVHRYRRIDSCVSGKQMISNFAR